MLKFLMLSVVSIIAATAAAQQNSLDCSSVENASSSPACYELQQGAKDYKERKFATAEQHFLRAKESNAETKFVNVFLARTLHQQYLANRTQPENRAKAEQAIEIYRRLLIENPNDETTNDALSSLLESLRGAQALLEWRSERADDEAVALPGHAKALTFMAADKYRCVNEITEAAKRTVEKNNEAVYVFKKPKNSQTFEEAKRCAEEGLILIDRALTLDAAKSSQWSYKASLLIQEARLAEMENNLADKERFEREAEPAKQRFVELSEKEAEQREQAAKQKNQ